MSLNWLKYAVKQYAESVYKQFGKSSGKMLLATSAIGVALSTLAQASAVLVNEKYSVSQKAFMIPQELTEGAISILSLFIITSPIQILAKKYSTTGKILSKDLKNYMEKNNLLGKRGNLDFNLKELLESEVKKLESTDTLVKSAPQEKESMLLEYQNLLNNYNALEDATSAIVTAAGSILSTAVILPFLRNYSASYYQKINMHHYNQHQTKKQSIQDFYSKQPLYGSTSGDRLKV